MQVLYFSFVGGSGIKILLSDYPENHYHIVSNRSRNITRYEARPPDEDIDHYHAREGQWRVANL